LAAAPPGVKHPNNYVFYSRPQLFQENFVIIKTRFSSSALQALSTLAVLWASSAYAQTDSNQSKAQPAADGLVPYRSAFEGYQPYSEEKIANWKATNADVASIGGWREYARQAQQVPNTPAQTMKAGEAAQPAKP
jgi:hypothetical protein